MRQGIQHELKMPPYTSITDYIGTEIMPQIHSIEDGDGVVIGVKHMLRDLLSKSIERLMILLNPPPGEYDVTAVVGAGCYFY